jgi:glutaryl-CoA dehydrogenase
MSSTPNPALDLFAPLAVDTETLLGDAVETVVDPSTAVAFEEGERWNLCGAVESYGRWCAKLDKQAKRVRQDVLDIVQDRWMPVASEMYQAGRFPDDVFVELGRVGAIGASLVGPGGEPMSKMATCAIMHALEYGDGGLRCSLTIQDSVIQALVRFGDDAQRARWLEPLLSGRTIASFALTEPNAGSDVRAVATEAKRSGGDWVINGQKGWITNSPRADVLVIWARTGERNDALRGFLVEKGTPGLDIERISGAASMRSGAVGRISLDGVRVPEAAVLPHAWGLVDISACLDYNRLTVIFGVMGAARFCLDAAVRYAKERRQFGVPIGSKQLVQEHIAEMATKVVLGEMLSLHLAGRWQSTPPSRFEVSLAKRHNCAAALDVARRARSLMGAHGIDLDHHVIRQMLNLEASSTYGGTHEIHSLVLGKTLTQESAF